MPVSIPVETAFFLYSILYGAAFFFAYDILRCIRRVLVHNIFWIAAEDLAFWMAAGILLFLMVFDKNSGILRSCFFLGIITGVLLWYFLFDRLVLKGVTWILCSIKKLIQGLFRFLGKPASFLWKRSVWTCHFIKKKMKKIARTLGKYLKKGMKIVKISGKQ